MPASQPDRSKRITAEDDVLATVHAFAAALHHVGAMDEADLRTMERLCLPPKPDNPIVQVRREMETPSA